VTIYWVRGKYLLGLNVEILKRRRQNAYKIIGGKKIDTKTKQIMNKKATFNERFAMKTILDFDVFNEEFEPKPVNIGTI
jgi:hypothetical protein